MQASMFAASLWAAMTAETGARRCALNRLALSRDRALEPFDQVGLRIIALDA
jgi:hypothetical protein